MESAEISGGSASLNNSTSDVENNICDSKKITAINKDTVHKICSGQVVLTLAVAVKELIENSIDAGATIIDINLKEYGADSIEVSDNGSGVLKENFQVLTLKHYTSKIREFDDLEHLNTLGFRGEALSSLSALSNLNVLTRHKSEEIGTKITYDCNGKIIKEVPIARQPGTTVTLENLFSPLPVRRKEFLKNLKREFNKMCQLLYAYCLVSKGIKFVCTNVTSKGSKSTVVATEGKQSLRENIISVFGARQISTLVEVEVSPPEEPILSEFNIKAVQGEEIPFKFEFYISSISHGSGRSTSDRQFYFINGRPCEPTKLMKLVNETYKQFNSNQYPFVYLNVNTGSHLIDVNVTPDKRQIFLGKENYLLACVKFSLLECFKTFPTSYKIQNSDVSKLLLNQTDASGRGLKRSISETSVKKGSILETFKKRSKHDNCKNKPVTDFGFTKNDSMKEDNTIIELIDDSDRNLDTLISIACKLVEKDRVENVCDLKNSSIKSDDNFGIETCKNNTNIPENVKICIDTPVKKTTDKKSVTVQTSIESIKRLLEMSNKSEAGDNSDVRVRFRSKIATDSNEDAENELQKQINKNDFKDMDIIGQFNLGFIITKLNNDLFIVDQHATDEKYNFEQLQSSTVLESQKLVSPKQLELTTGNEALLIENEEVFKKNGFAFKIDHDAPSMKKVLLTAIPMSKSYVFGKDDIDEMLFMLQDNSHAMCRPSRIRGMFASRACRKSVMIGKHLAKADMRQLINHMGEIEQPWNCPHGRPTMRHLINLDLICDD